MEQKLISWLEETFSGSVGSNQRVILGIGDDGAILRGGDAHQVHVADAIVENVHFDLSKHALKDVGCKAISVNLSDIAAMGAVAESVLVNLVLPRRFELNDAKELLNGLAEVADHYNVAILGGDTTRHEGPLIISVSATGRIPKHFACPEGWRMDGAQVGDLIVITGSLGGSIKGHHLTFEPRLDVARSIQERVSVNAATDISDSLSLDLSHVLRKSKAAGMLECDLIPISEAAKSLAAATGLPALQHALNDGEDFELLLSISKQNYEKLVADVSFTHPLSVIGSIVGGESGQIYDADSGEKIDAVGYEHR